MPDMQNVWTDLARSFKKPVMKNVLRSFKQQVELTAS